MVENGKNWETNDLNVPMICFCWLHCSQDALLSPETV